MDRHKELSIRTSEKVSKARAGVTEASVRLWFNQLHKNLTDLNAMEIFDDPTRIFNADETNMQLCPKTGKVIGIKGWKNCYEINAGPEKSTLTFLGTFRANGDIITPTIIYPYVRIPRDITDAIPDEFHYLTTDSGWMTSEAFFHFVMNVFNKWLDEHKVKKPVILFVDGHKTHITLQLSVNCEEVGIILYLLPPNTTHLLQPADVGPFKPLKHYWRKEVRQQQQNYPDNDLKRRNVAPLLKNTLAQITRASIINGFKRTGLCPLNVEAVDFSKMLDINIVDEDGNVEEAGPSSNRKCTLAEYKAALSVIQEVLGPRKIRENSQSRVTITSDLYNLYQEVKTKANRVSNEQNPNNIGDVPPVIEEVNTKANRVSNEQNPNNIGDEPPVIMLNGDSTVYNEEDDLSMLVATGIGPSFLNLPTESSSSVVITASAIITTAPLGM